MGNVLAYMNVVQFGAGLEKGWHGRRYLVIKQAWPSCMRTLSGDHNRFETTYFKVCPGHPHCGQLFNKPWGLASQRLIDDYVQGILKGLDRRRYMSRARIVIA